ncbi:HCN3 [Bugula neritina]|uniref:HCN3 n=1 Tax=Bugula neritina TaxID=10212 RepID=A0A7J7J0M3_BUGNE|nr:HCN3 [Bugula neritina]
MLIFLVTNLVVLPVAIAFFFSDMGSHWMIFNITCDTLFILDIFINFRTGIIDADSHGNVILDGKLIAIRYLKSWFVIDFVSSMPIDYIFLKFDGSSYKAGRAIRILRLAKLLQLLRLLRISRLVRYIRIWQENVHWWDQYTKSLFKALSHMLCIGYGQYPPSNNTDMWLTIASMLAGATCYALFVGHATTLIQSFDTSSRQFRDHLQQVNEYMSFRKLPQDLRRKITAYYDHKYGGKMFDEQVILNELSHTLRADILYHNCQALVHTVPFFVNADPNFVSDVITKLHYEMYMPGELIVKANTKGDKMFFIQEGLVEVVDEHNEKVVTRLSDGSYFGEISLLSNQMRMATVRATTYCNLFSLSKEDFDSILMSYPLMRRTLETIAAQRLRHLGKDPSMVTSRESLLDDVNGIQRAMQVDPESISDDEENADGEENISSNNQFLTAVKSFFTTDSDRHRQLFRPNSYISSPRRAKETTLGHTSKPQVPRIRSNLHHLLAPVVLPAGPRRSKSSIELSRMKSESQSCSNTEAVSTHSPSLTDKNTNHMLQLPVNSATTNRLSVPTFTSNDNTTSFSEKCRVNKDIV